MADYFLSSLVLLSISAVLIVLTSRFQKISGGIFLFSLGTGCVLGLISAVSVLVHRIPIDYRLNFRMPIGEFYVGVDPLSAFFLLTIVMLSLFAGIYGFGYLKDDEKKNLSVHYALYLVLLISLMLVVTAKNAVLFLVAWEMMAISSYFLITFDDEKEAVRKAGYLYLIATHTGTFCLWVMFLLMGQQAGSMNFDQMTLASFPLPLAGVLFILGIIGFGVKAGFIPFHIWLPHAHPAAPSHVSAVLSGVMIKMGIYGLMRLILIVKNFPEWCAMVLLMIGMISGVGGVLYALGQHEIKKLLAYHSIENIGIITLGLGIGLWGQIDHNEAVALIGYAGALLHVFNHAIFKGLLFLSAGSVIRSTHTGEIDHLGGLLKKLPWTGHLFLVGSLSICGLPLFNGFISEWLVFRALFDGVFHFKTNALVFSSLAIISLALIGGLATACFAKAFGAIFLGSGRSVDNTHWEENSSLMRAPMVVLGGICLWVGFFPSTMVSFALGAASTIASLKISPMVEEAIISPLLTVVWVLMILVTIITVLVLFKRIAMKFLPIEKAPTWGCGYSMPTNRMQYTASSFAEPILRIFRNVLGFNVTGNKPQGYFPKEEAISSHVIEASEDFIFRPIFQFIKSLSAKLKIIQSGVTQLYLLYIFIFLLILLIWKMV
ncbi:MAG: proton-conducting transporter membrane subunit [Candidatus Omnitrophota bacterium]|nr:proton-conducting transporter membrane subunit [Candidatus Omnitrophota bacterium]